MYVGSLAGVTCLPYTALTNPKKGETAVHCCNPALSVLFKLVSRNVFHVVSALQSIVCLLADQISYVDPTLEAFIVCGPLQFLASSWFEPGIQSKTSSWSAVNLKMHVMEMTSKLESAIWSRNIDQRIPCFHRCQLTITWMSNTEEECYKPRVNVSPTY